MDSARVRFLVQPDAWAAWEALPPPADALELAWAEYGDERLVAAYVLETVCGDARQKAAEALAAAGPQTKSYEVVGDWKEEYFGPVQSAESAQADSWCKRAAVLRMQVRRAGLLGSVARSSRLVLPERLGCCE